MPRNLLPLLVAWVTAYAVQPTEITFDSLLDEMVDRSVVTELPAAPYKQLQASSYNRASVSPDKPNWIVEQDGEGFIRKEKVGDHDEWVVMEHTGSGCLTRIWTPFFHRQFNNRVGPDIRIYIDGSPEPVIAENFIKFVQGQGSVKPPFAETSARAGNCYLPIPFGKSCKVTMSAKPFYHLITYRAYAPGTLVRSFAKDQLATSKAALDRAARALATPGDRMAAKAASEVILFQGVDLGPGESLTMGPSDKPALGGQGEIRELTFHFKGDDDQLRTTLWSMTFDGEKTVELPLGDAFNCPDAIHPSSTWERTVKARTMTCRWPMPYRESAQLTLRNLSTERLRALVEICVAPRPWTDRSLHFGASWMANRIEHGDKLVDMTFVELKGAGLLVGDGIHVVCAVQDWWGEGDEKIYVDGDRERRFPSHFGTGTEDYYGWAGGVIPTPADEFSRPFVANVKVGGVDGNLTRGHNICARSRSLDAIPFDSYLRFDMEASPGLEHRQANKRLGYSSVSFWYARPGAVVTTRPPESEAAKPSLGLADVETLVEKAGSRKQEAGK